MLLFLAEKKNYAFSSSSGKQPTSTAGTGSTDDAVIHVKLSNELEEAMLALIKKESSVTSTVGHISQRLNARKLTVLVTLFYELHI